MTKAYRPEDNKGWFHEDHKAAKKYHGLGEQNLRPFLQEMMQRGEHVNASTKDAMVRYANGKDESDGYELHGRFVGALQHRKEFVNIENDGFLRKHYDITASRDRVKDAALHVYATLVASHERDGLTQHEARAVVEKQAVREGVTTKGETGAVLIHPSYIPALKTYLEQEKKWSTAQTASSPQKDSSHGERISGRPETIDLAMSHLFDLEVKALQRTGVVEEKAVKMVSAQKIRLRQDEDHPERVQWQVHDTYRNKVDALVKKVHLQDPQHREDSWYAVAKEQDVAMRDLAKKAWIEPVVFLNARESHSVDGNDSNWVNIVSAKEKAAVALIVNQRMDAGESMESITSSAVRLANKDAKEPYWKVHVSLMPDVMAKLKKMPDSGVSAWRDDITFKHAVTTWNKLEASAHSATQEPTSFVERVRSASRDGGADRNKMS
jgi:hypothetical protein